MADSNPENLPQWFQEHVPVELATSSMFRFNVKLQNGTVVSIDLTKDIDINFEILEEQHERIPAQYIYWAALYSELKSCVTVLEMKVKSQKKKIVQRMFEEFRAKNMKPTDKQTTTIIDGNAELLRLEAELALVQRSCGKVWHMVKAIELRSEHTRSLAGFKRQEKEQSGRLT